MSDAINSVLDEAANCAEAQTEAVVRLERLVEDHEGCIHALQAELYGLRQDNSRLRAEQRELVLAANLASELRDELRAELMRRLENLERGAR